MAKEIRSLNRYNESAEQTEIFYPATTTDAIAHPTKRKSLTDVISDIEIQNGAYDISAANSGRTYADLAAALDSNNGGGVPLSSRKGGMSIKFVQSSDNKYVQYRLTNQTFNTNISYWEKVDDVPNNFSNMVDLGCVVEIPAGQNYKDFTLNSFVTKGGQKVLFFVSRPDIVSQVRLITSGGSAHITYIDGYVTERQMTNLDTAWSTLRVIISSVQQSNTLVKINICDKETVNIPSLYKRLKETDIEVQNLNTEIVVSYSNMIERGGKTTVPQGSDYVDVDINHFTSVGGNTYYFYTDEPDKVKNIRFIDYSSVVSNLTTVNDYVTEINLPANNYEWNKLRITLEQNASTATDIKYQICINGKPSIPCLENRVKNLERTNTTGVLPLSNNYPIVIGNKLELFKHSICYEIYNENDIFVTNDGKNFSSNNYGKFRENAYYYEPAQTSTQFSLEFNEVDRNGFIVAKKEISILPCAKKNSPSSNINVLIIGDSYTYQNVWCKEFARRLLGNGGTPIADGLSNITFVGTQNTGEGDVRTEGHSSWSIWNFTGSGSPFYFNGAIDIAAYNQSLGISKIDIVIILLGANGTRDTASYKSLIDKFITANNNTIFLLGTNAMKYGDNGWSNSLGLIAGLNTTQWRNEWRQFTQDIQTTFEDYTNVHYVDVPCQVDTENNFGYIEVDANNRNSSVKVKQGVENVHPANSAYYQIADIFYNAFHCWCLT